MNDSIPLRYTLVCKEGNEENINKITSSFNITQLFSSAEEIKNEEFLSVPSDNENIIIKMISNIDKKLNLIINLLAKGDELLELIKQKPTDVNINGSGMRFLSSTKFEKGDILKLEMVLPNFPFSIVEICGEVVWVKKVGTKKGAALYSNGVKFVKIDESCRDEIIFYILKRQRDILRDEEK